MSEVETERLDRAREHVWVAERALHADPTNKWLKMLADLLRDEVKTVRQISVKDSTHKQKSQRRRGLPAHFGVGAR
jgi:hypothetical protein